MQSQPIGSIVVTPAAAKLCASVSCWPGYGHTRACQLFGSVRIPVVTGRSVVVTDSGFGWHRDGVCDRCHLADTPVGGSPVVVELTPRWLVRPGLECSRRTFREQVPGRSSVTPAALLSRRR